MISFEENKDKPVQEGSFAFDDNSVVIGQKAAQAKASIIDAALVENSPGVGMLYSDLLSNGDDTRYRKSYESSEVSMLEEARYAAINDTLAGKTQEEISASFEDLAKFDPAMSATPLSINLEKGYAKTGFNLTQVLQETSDPLDRPTQSPTPELDAFLYEEVTDNVAISKVIQQLREELSLEDDGFQISDVADYGQQLIPLRSWYITQNALPGFDGESILPGSNKKEYIDSIRSLPVAERADAIRKTFYEIKSRSDLEAWTFLRNVEFGYSSRSAFWDNVLIAGGDVASLPITKLGKAAIAPLKAARNAKAIEKGLKSSKPLMEVPQELGETSLIAQQSILAVTTGDMSPIYRNWPFLFNTTAVARGNTTLNTKVNHILEVADQTMNKALQTITETASIDRINPEQLKIGIDDARATILRDAPGVEHHLIDLGPEPLTFDRITNTQSYSFRFGRKDGSLFDSEDFAQQWAEDYLGLATDDFRVKTNGSGFYVEVVRDIDESVGIAKSLSDLEIKTKFAGGSTPVDNVFEMAKRIGGVRNVVSESNMGARILSTSGTENIIDAFNKVLQPIADLSGKEQKKLRKTLVRAQGTWNGTSYGINYSIDEFMDAYQAMHKIPASDKTISAYVAYRNVNDLEYLIRDAGRIRDMRRIGAQNLEFTAKVGDTEEIIVGLGKKVDSLPFASTERQRVAFIDKDGSVTFRSVGGGFNEKTKELFDQFIKDGGEIVQSLDGMLEIGGDVANFVVSKQVIKKNRLSAGTFGYNQGGHRIAKYSNWLKQAKVKGKDEGVGYYTGDNVWLNAFTPQQAEKIANAMNRVRLSIKDGTEDWKRIVETELNFTSKKEVLSLFRGQKAKFDLDQPFVATKDGERAIDKGGVERTGRDIVDATSGKVNPLGQLDRRFAQERAADDARIVREQLDGTMVLDRAPILSPMEALSVGANSTIPVRLQKDYMYHSLNDILTEAAVSGNRVFNTDIRKILDDPLDYLHFPEKYYNPAISPADKARMETLRKTTLMQFENKGVEQRILDSFSNKMANLFAPGSKPFEIVDAYLLPLVKDPFTFMRSVAFHSSMGFFNYLQIPVQAQTFGVMAGLAPQYATQAMWAMALQKGLMFTERENIKRFVSGKYLEGVQGQIPKGAFNLTEDQFVEMTDLLKKTGYHHVKGTYAQLDTAFHTAINSTNKVKRSAKSLFNAGTVFFTQIEESLRYAGWNIAYMEFRKANPTKAVTDADLAKIVSRADDLNVNMHSANNAQWQRGIFAMPLQFQTYNIRLMEMITPSLIGKGRIDPKLAWLTVGISGLLYGAGGAASTGLNIWPWHESIKEEALKRGFQINDTWYEAMFEGVPDYLLKRTTGVDLDIANRYAPANSFFKDVIDAISGEGGKSLAELLAGPGGAAIARATSGALSGLYNWATSKGEYSLTTQDWIDAVNGISTFRHIHEWKIAAEYDRWVSRQGYNDAKVRNEREAFYFLLLGAKPDYVIDRYSTSQMLYDEKQSKAQQRKEATKLLQRATLIAETNPEEALQLKKNAGILLYDFSEAEKIKVFADSLSEPSSVDREENNLEKRNVKKYLEGN